MRITKIFFLLGCSALLCSANTYATHIFFQDFETLGDGTHVETVHDASGYTRNVSCGSNCPYSQAGSYTTGMFTDTDADDNWGVHDQSTNSWASGGLPYANPHMSGNVMGHVFHNYDNNEATYYQIDNIHIDSHLDYASLMFDFDSWVEDDKDGFAVAICANGTCSDGYWDLLLPTSGSDMQYRPLGEYTKLDNLTEYDSGPLCGGTSNQNCGFDGHDASMVMAGKAMFDLSAYIGDTIDLRFAWASDGTTGGTCYFGDGTSSTSSCSTAEGINIDNIKIKGGKDTPGVPEPSSIALMMLGATAFYRRRRSAS